MFFQLSLPVLQVMVLRCYQNWYWQLEAKFFQMFFVTLTKDRCTSCIMMSTISPNVDFVGHFAGMLAGFLLAVILADMQEEHQPPWYNKAKFTATGHDFFWLRSSSDPLVPWKIFSFGSCSIEAKNVTALIVIVSLVRAITLGPVS